MKVRRPTLAETIVQMLLGLLLALLAFDLLDAVGESACSAPAPTKGCYPWGAEGPAAGLWTYSNKRNYVGSSLASILTLGAAIMAPLVASGVGTSLGAVAVILTVGFGGLEIAGLFLR